ncbi:hypothetical protein AKJ18_25690 [Vibrio xuii]|nr:hypothetical protein AKJ18_25690 [Vibrio xuii]
MDIMHAMKDALMKYETIDAGQIDDLMERKADIREPAGWGDNPSNKHEAKADKPVDEKPAQTEPVNESDDNSSEAPEKKDSE